MQRSLARTFAATLASGALVLSAVATAGPASARESERHDVGLGYTQVVLAPEVYQLIAGAGITPAPLGPATAFPYLDTLATRYPISGFSLYNLRIKHVGGVSLSAGDANIELRRFWIDLGRLRVSGRVDGSATGDVGRVDLFKIRFSDRLQYGLVKLTLTDTAAGALNATFGVDAFSENATFGYATPRPFADIEAMKALAKRAQR